MIPTLLRKEMPHGSEPQLEAKSPQVDPQEVQLWLEWAGERMLSIRVQGTRPSSFRSSWPDYADDPHTAYGYNGPSLRFPSPSAQDISLMDEVLGLINLCPQDLQRRVLQARALIKPSNGQHLYSWSKIAVKIHSDHRTVKNLHQRGLEAVAWRVPVVVLLRVRVSLGSGPSESS